MKIVSCVKEFKGGKYRKTGERGWEGSARARARKKHATGSKQKPEGRKG